MVIPDFVKDATNVYRTENYIVKQRIVLESDVEEGENLCSYDTFYSRTAKRDAEYVAIFASRRKINGKRMRMSLSTRRYVA